MLFSPMGDITPVRVQGAYVSDEDLEKIVNHTIKEQKAVSSDRCTMCYRCINKCPKQALTLLGKRVVEQCGIEKYI